MGKGDKKTKHGKIIMGSHGVRRPRKKSNSPVVSQREDQPTEKATKTKAAEASTPKTEESKPKAAAKPKAAKKPKDKTEDDKPADEKGEDQA